MVLPVVAVFIAKALTTVWSFRVKLVRIFQERLSEISMGRFISHYGRTGQVQTTHEEMCQVVINAYIALISLPCLLCVYGKEIKETPMLDFFFSQYLGYRKWLGIEGVIGDKEIPVRNEAGLMKDVINLFGIVELLAQVPKMLGDFVTLMVNIISAMWHAVKDFELNPYAVCNHINQHFFKSDFHQWLAQIPPHFWRLMHPTLDLDWTVIKSAIMLLSTYRAIRTGYDLAGYARPYFMKQKVKIQDDEKLDILETLDDEGTLVKTVSMKDLGTKLTLDTYRLRFDHEMRCAEPRIRMLIPDMAYAMECWTRDIWFGYLPEWDIVAFVSDDVDLPYYERDFSDFQICIREVDGILQYEVYHSDHDRHVEAFFDLFHIATCEPTTVTVPTCVSKGEIQIKLIPKVRVSIYVRETQFEHHQGNMRLVEHVPDHDRPFRFQSHDGGVIYQFEDGIDNIRLELGHRDGEIVCYAVMIRRHSTWMEIWYEGKNIMNVRPDMYQTDFWQLASVGIVGLC